jgi:S1-C subfamily serine protease
VESDDELDDERPSGLLLPPDDRLWRHPSELAVAGSARSGSRSADNRMWTVAILSGIIGALLATGAVYAVGGVRTRKVAVAALERDVDSTPVVTLASTSAESSFVTGAERVQSSCVILVARNGHETRVSNGVVFRSDGMVLTTAHMVDGAQSLTATIGTRKIAARLVASDPASDLAIVKLQGSSFDPAPMGSALDLRVGDPVINIELGGSVPGDQGSIAALGQQVTGSGGAVLTDLVAVATTGEPGMVGEPVLDSHGAVVAIGTALGKPSDRLEYATPVDLARQIAVQLLATGRVVPVWLGVQGTDVTPAEARMAGIDGGALVSRIYDDSPAQTAGLRTGDIVVGLDGREVTSMANLIMAVHAEPPGTDMELDVDRAGRQQVFMVVLTPRPPDIN